MARLHRYESMMMPPPEVIKPIGVDNPLTLNANETGLTVYV